MKRNALIKLLLSFVLFIWLVLGSFSFILNQTVTANYQMKQNQETFIEEVNQRIQNYSLGANLPKSVLASVMTESDIQAGPKKINYSTIKKRIVEKINQYQAENTASQNTEEEKENVNKLVDEIINKIKGEINTSFLFLNQMFETIVPIITTFTMIMSINAVITIVLLFVLFKKTVFNYLCYSFWSTAIILASGSIVLWLIPFDQIALSSKTNIAVLNDLVNHISSLGLGLGIVYLILGSILSFLEPHTKNSQNE